MLEEHMIDMEGGYGEMWSHSWRCFNCGHRDDAMLQYHRQLHAKRVAASPLTVPTHEAIDLPWDSEAVEPLAA
jgi:hypothetical protein